MNNFVERIGRLLLRFKRQRRAPGLEGGIGLAVVARRGAVALVNQPIEADEVPGERGTERDSSIWTRSTDATHDPNETVPLKALGGGWGSGAKAPAGPSGVAGAPDSNVSRYRILGLLGRGGMGAVYRAEDTRLGRTVALKFLPPGLMANPGAKERFLFEARAASTLDHPNICTVHEIEEMPDGQLCLVMACYDGETLQSRLARAPLAPAEAVDVAQQVARGLAKAHRQGIVHCDIKPANLMFTADGVVKILDFGISKHFGQSGAGLGRSSFGTPGYRSPEQARGEEVTAASDIWSLGVVLNQMLTGRPPGRGTQGDTFLPLELSPDSARRPEAPQDLDKPEKSSPPELVKPEIQPELDGILSRMLAQHAVDRYPDTAELLADLDRIGDRIRGRSAEGRAARRRKRVLAASLGGAVACLAILGGSVILRLGGLSLGDRPARAWSQSIVQVTDFPVTASYPSLSPDGGTVVYVRSVERRRHIFSQPAIRGADPTDLTADSPADDTQPSFSPDGRQIAFRSERSGGGIFLMSANGGEVRRLTDFGFNPSWSPAGKEIVCSTANITAPQIRPTASEVFRVDVATGARRRVTHGDAAHPTWSPHGKRIAYWGVLPATGRRLIWTVPAAGGEAIPAVNDYYLNWNPVWSPDGRHLYFVSDRTGIMNLWRVPIDEETGLVQGKPEPVTASQQAGMLLSLSCDGRKIAFASDGSRAVLERVEFEPVTGEVIGSAVTITSTSDLIIACDSSPDGQWLTYQLLTPQEDLFVIHPDGSGRRRLIGDKNKNREPQFSPDGLRIAFDSNRSGIYQIWTIGIDGRGLTQETNVPRQDVISALWSPDGRMLACEVGGREAFIDLTRPVSERLPQFLPPPGRGAEFIASSWSSNGRWLAGAARRLGASQDDPGILLYSLADKRYLRLTGSGFSPVWLHDCRRLLFVEGDRLFLLDTKDGKSRPVLAPPADSTYRDVSVSPDDKTLFLLRTIYENHIWLLNLN